jgi:predicted P-loop ATPase
LQHAPEFVGALQFNDFSNAIETTKTLPWRALDADYAVWTDADNVKLAVHLERSYGLYVKDGWLIPAAVKTVAQDTRIHPVRQHIESVEWDGRERVKGWLIEYLGATEQPADYLHHVGKLWLLQAIARVYKPGAKADHVLVLEGKQGAGKSSVAATLAMFPGWFADDLPALDGKDAAIQLSGRWIVELAELASARKSKTEAVKAFITRTQDVYRPPYERYTVTTPRQCVFIATTNEQEYLPDRTGNRRFWPVRVGAIALDSLRRDCLQLWAEALTLYRAGESHLPSPAFTVLAEAEQEQRVLLSELERKVMEYLRWLEGEGTYDATAEEIFGAIGIAPESSAYADQTQKHASAVGAAIARAGWRKLPQRKTVRGKKHTVYVKPTPRTRRGNID